jgi:DNA-binding transcriptional LysR family regulator
VRLAAVNLNHLVALDLLLTERSVGRAAGRLGVTQSALSHTLRSLREITGDRLLVRSGNAMVLTPFAEEARERLTRGLAELEAVVSGRAGFDPSTVTDTFTLATFDGVAAMMAAALRMELEARAPRATLRIQAVDPQAAVQQLESGDVDVLALPPVLNFDGLAHEEIERRSARFTEFSVVCRRDHSKIRRRLSLAQYCAIPHAVGSLTGEGSTFIDDLLAQHGRSRRVEFRAPYMLALVEVVATSDLICTLPTAMAEFFCERWPLRRFPLPLPFGGSNLELWWHPRFTGDPAHAFFRGVVQSAARTVVSQHSDRE